MVKFCNLIIGLISRNTSTHRIPVESNPRNLFWVSLDNPKALGIHEKEAVNIANDIRENVYRGEYLSMLETLSMVMLMV